MESNINNPEIWINTISKSLSRFLLYVIIIVSVALFLIRIRSILITLFLAGAFAYIIRPVAKRLAASNLFIMLHGGPRFTSRQSLRILSSLYVLVLFLFLGWMSIRVIMKPFVHELKRVTENWGTGGPEDLSLKLEQNLFNLKSWYSTRIPEGWRKSIENQIDQGQNFQNVRARMAGWISSALPHARNVVQNIVEIVLLPVLAFYFAVDSKRLKHEFVSILPRKWWREVFRMVHVFNGIMHSYLIGQAILCVLAGVIVGIGLWLLRMDYWVILGLLAGFTRAIPIIGPILGGIPIILLAFITKGFAVALGVLIFFTLLNFAESKFIMPYIIGDRMNLHPLVIIIVLLIGEEFGGLLGMFFAAPIAALVREILRRYWLKPREYQRHSKLKPVT